MPNAIKSRASTGEKPRINSDILALLMHGYPTFNMLVPEPFRKVPLLLDPILGIVQRICGALKIVSAVCFALIHSYLVTRKSVIGKQRRPRSDATLCGV